VTAQGLREDVAIALIVETDYARFRFEVPREFACTLWTWWVNLMIYIMIREGYGLSCVRLPSLHYQALDLVVPGSCRMQRRKNTSESNVQ